MITVGDKLGEIYGRAAALGWGKAEPGRVEVASVVAQVAAMPPGDRALLEAFCRQVVDEAEKGGGK